MPDYQQWKVKISLVCLSLWHGISLSICDMIGFLLWHDISCLPSFCDILWCFSYIFRSLALHTKSKTNCSTVKFLNWSKCNRWTKKFSKKKMRKLHFSEAYNEIRDACLYLILLGFLFRTNARLEAELCKIKSRYVILLKEFSIPLKGILVFSPELQIRNSAEIKRLMPCIVWFDLLIFYFRWLQRRRPWSRYDSTFARWCYQRINSKKYLGRC